MPLFEYRCAQCHHLEEVLQKHGEPAPEECPACGAKATLDKEVSLTSFQLKGGGWYKDLYSSTSNNASGGSSDSAAKTKESSGKTETSSTKSDTSAKKDSGGKAPAKKSSGKVA